MIVILSFLLAAELPKAELLGRFDPKAHPAFVTTAEYTLRREAADAFERMRAAARRDGVELRIVSSTRNFDSQRGIWERKWRALPATLSPAARAKQILRYSSMPGTSRHHWGTDIDLNQLNAAWFRTGDGLRLYDWLARNAAAHGFCQPYTAKGPDRTAGYEEEPWHWSYRPLASVYLRQYLAAVTVADISGFTGSGEAAGVGAITNYVSGVSSACR